MKYSTLYPPPRNMDPSTSLVLPSGATLALTYYEGRYCTIPHALSTGAPSDATASPEALAKVVAEHVFFCYTNCISYCLNDYKGNKKMGLILVILDPSLSHLVVPGMDQPSLDLAIQFSRVVCTNKYAGRCYPLPSDIHPTIAEAMMDTLTTLWANWEMEIGYAFPVSKRGLNSS